MKTWGTISEAASLIGCTNRWVQMLTKDGRIKFEWFGNQYRVWLPDAEKYRRSREAKSRNGKQATS